MSWDRYRTFVILGTFQAGTIAAWELAMWILRHLTIGWAS